MTQSSRRKAALLAMLPLTALAVPAFAQEQEAPPVAPQPPVTNAGDQAEPGDIVVVAKRLAGSVVAPQPPVTTLDEQDVQSYGASSITDLLDQLGPETNSGRGRSSGRPVVLLNGQRVSSFRELRNIPPEAIRRVEVLPEEVALRYGYSPDLRVVNFILKDNFSSRTARVKYSVPTAGGFSTGEYEGSLFQINGPSRLNLTATLDHTSPLFESERDIRQAEGSVPTVAGDRNPADFRTLIADSRDFSVNGTWSTGLGEKGMAGGLTLNATITRNDTHSYSGLNVVTLTDAAGNQATRTFGDPLGTVSHTVSAEGGVTYNRPIGTWQLTATVDAGHTTTDTYTDRRADVTEVGDLQRAALAGTQPLAGALPAFTPTGQDHAFTASDSATSLVTLIGHPLHLPAGDVSATIKAGFAYTAIDSRDTRTSALGDTKLHRGDASVGVNLGIPLTSRRNDVLAGIGDLTLNLSGGLNHLSDFGTLKDWSAGLTWSPTGKLGLQASYIVNEAAPALSDLGNPQVLTFNVPVYDFALNHTSLVTIVNGGNPDLVRQKQRDIKLSANWQLPFFQRSNLIVEYFHNESDNVTAAFPLLTPAIEAAFPGRVVRDPTTGELLTIYRQPVTFYRENSSRLRYGFNLSGKLGKRSAASADGNGGSGGRRGGGGGFAGRMMGGPGGNGQGRWNLSIFHTIQFTDTVTVAAGSRPLDLLSGDALTGGGVARHSVELEGGGFYRGFGLRANGTYTAPTNVRSSGTPGSSDLHFGGLFKLNLRAFADLGQQKKLTQAVPFFKGSRLSITVNNVFNARQRVTDGAGEVPITYQPDFLDPQGRVIGVEFRKMF